MALASSSRSPVKAARLEQAELMQISWRLRRQRDEIAECFVESLIGAGAEHSWLLLVGKKIEGVPELVMDRVEILGIDVEAALQPHILLAIEGPGIGPAPDVTI